MFLPPLLCLQPLGVSDRGWLAPALGGHSSRTREASSVTPGPGTSFGVCGCETVVLCLTPTSPPLRGGAPDTAWGCRRLRTHRLVRRKCSAEFVVPRPVSLSLSRFPAWSLHSRGPLCHQPCPGVSWGPGQVASCSSLGHEGPLPCTSPLSGRLQRATTDSPPPLPGRAGHTAHVGAVGHGGVRVRGGRPSSSSSRPVCRSQTLLDLAEVGLLINGQGSSGRPSPPSPPWAVSPWGPPDQYPSPAHGARLHLPTSLCPLA